MESVFKFVEPKQEAAPQGLIKFFGLERWWLNEIEVLLDKTDYPELKEAVLKLKAKEGKW